ncbi:olfactory receptor 1G1-like [Rhinophrynus dorsalis]
MSDLQFVQPDTVCSEVFLLAGMSYDRYTAICHPLHYIHIMSWKVCVLLVSGAWTLGFCNSVLALGITFIPYVQIFQAILRIPSKVGKHKAFSTCTSHLTVVFIFYGTTFFTYLRPAPKKHNIGDSFVSLIYTVITPLLNPFIYSLRNKELKGALRNVLHKCHYSNMNIH